MTKGRKKIGGHLVFCANLISAVALEGLYNLAQIWYIISL